MQSIFSYGFDVGVVSDVGFGWDCPGMQQCSSLDGLSVSVRLPKLPGDWCASTLRQAGRKSSSQCPWLPGLQAETSPAWLPALGLVHGAQEEKERLESSTAFTHPKARSYTEAAITKLPEKA